MSQIEIRISGTIIDLNNYRCCEPIDFNCSDIFIDFVDLRDRGVSNLDSAQLIYDQLHPVMSEYIDSPWTIWVNGVNKGTSVFSSCTLSDDYVDFSYDDEPRGTYYLLSIFGCEAVEVYSPPDWDNLFENMDVGDPVTVIVTIGVMDVDPNKLARLEDLKIAYDHIDQSPAIATPSEIISYLGIV